MRNALQMEIIYTYTCIVDVLMGQTIYRWGIFHCHISLSEGKYLARLHLHELPLSVCMLVAACVYVSAYVIIDII